MLGDLHLDTPATGAGRGALPWQEACISFAQDMFDALARHGNVAPLLIGLVPMGPNALALRERILSVLLDVGFPPATAALTYASLSRYVLGFAIQLTGSEAEGAQRSGQAELSAKFHEMDPSQYPATVAASDHLPVPLAEEFAFGLRRIVVGLEALHGSV